MAVETAVMAVKESPKGVSGVWAPALTPLDADLAADHVRAAQHTARLLAEGCHGVVLFGTTGEATSFSVSERMAVLEAVLAAGTPRKQVIVGTGCAALSDSVALARHAIAHGCSRQLVLPPFYFKNVSDDGLYGAFAELIDRVASENLQIYLYHFPRLSCVPISHSVIERLLKSYPGIIRGIKDSTGDPSSCADFAEAFPTLAVFPGTEAILLDMLKRGAAGTITAVANVNAQAIRNLYDAWAVGNGDLAASLHKGVLAVRRAVETLPSIPALKEIVAARDGDPAWRRVRPPLTRLTEKEAGGLFSALAAAGFPVAVER